MFPITMNTHVIALHTFGVPMKSEVQTWRVKERIGEIQDDADT